VRRSALLLGAVLAIALPASTAQAADECAGLLVCIPVAGPWVVVPPATSSTSSARWELRCPQGAIGGTDARISERAVDVGFFGRVGSPVGPGVTTTDRILFVGRYVGAVRSHGASFRPFIGCVPAAGGGRRIPTSSPSAEPKASVAAAQRPGAPITVRTKTIAVAPSRLARGSLRCRANERLLRATTASALLTSEPPTMAQARSIAVVRVVRGGRVLVSARRQGQASEAAARVQIQAECAR
jgi:hypothetical protein